MIQHHKAFKNFKPYVGKGRKCYTVNFLGVFTDISHLYPVGSQEYQNINTNEQMCIQTQYPEFNEGYFEYINVLESVLEARQDFTAIELGAGFAPHLVNAAVAIRSYHGSDFPCKLIGVEGEPTSYLWMKKHFLDNGINPDNHKLIEAVVSDQDGYAFFEVGYPLGYGGYIVKPWQQFLKPLKESYRFIKRVFKKLKGQKCDAKDFWTGEKGLGLYTKKVQSITLNNLLNDFKKVDFIHLDIHGEEYRILNSVFAQLSKKVKRVYIGTHNSDVERKLRKLFSGNGWKSIFDFSGNGKRITPFGEIIFADGLQYWINPQID